MNNDARTPRSTSRLFYAACTAWLAALMLLTAPVAVMAQETTTDVQGTVFQPDGQPAAGQSVSITDDRTGAVRRTTSAANGTFSIRGLPVGGPYTIRVESSEFQNAVVTDVFTNLSAAANFDIRLGESAQIEEITVTAKQVQKVEMAIGPGTAFSVQELQEMPSIARQIRDVIRIDPRVQIGRNDNGGGSGINCLGGAPRSNSITIDGALANDGFGLNEGTGTSARFAFPIPFDTIASTSVEFAPLDVQYSQFTGCAINVVTKPGSNEFSGSVFYLYNDDSLTGDTLEGNTVITDPFEDKNYGFNLSGPIIKDHLFFTVAYEEPSGDEEADFARMLSQFKDKVTENLDTSDVRAHYDLGTAYKEMGLLDEAISSFQAALRASADHLPTYELMGQTFMEMGQPEAAVKSLERAVEAANTVEDELVGIYYYLGRAYEELQNRDSAVEYYDRVFALDINFADVTERLRELR